MRLTISRILHAGYLFECANTKIAFDPLFESPFSRNCYSFPPVTFDLEKVKKLKLDAVFISHFHDDHCSMESLNLIDRGTPIYIFCVFPEMLELIRQLGFTDVHALVLNHTVVVNTFRVTAKRALDADVDSIFYIQAAGLNILNVVDSWIDDEVMQDLLKIKKWDLILWPFQTMREIEVIAPRQATAASPLLPPEWLQQLGALNPKYLVPSSCQFQFESWSWYNRAFFPISYAQFTLQVRAALPAIEVCRLDPGISVQLDQQGLSGAASLDFIQHLSPPTLGYLDYEYSPPLTLPPTAEVAKHFTPLDESQKSRILNYCKTELPERIRNLNESDDPYFKKTRTWRLRIYDHRGEVQNFFYKICGNQIESLTKVPNELHWTTEVPAAKLWAALELGESLTSMYLRVNDYDFSDATKIDLRDIDIIDDPLIRSLFNGAFASYQIAQLKKILT